MRSFFLGSKLLQTAMHWENRLFLTFESRTVHFVFFLTV